MTSLFVFPLWSAVTTAAQVDPSLLPGELIIPPPLRAHVQTARVLQRSPPRQSQRTAGGARQGDTNCPLMRHFSVPRASGSSQRAQDAPDVNVLRPGAETSSPGRMKLSCVSTSNKVPTRLILWKYNNLYLQKSFQNQFKTSALGGKNKALCISGSLFMILYGLVIKVATHDFESLSWLCLSHIATFLDCATARSQVATGRQK